ncbi:hypothetical protein RRG08_062078 [Elysia crispata]|uniref:Uncharacterized protein n=1 Tax=Elysia crispata TaxID=231223 RepID=A0AAE1DHK8_9GAST|nr:hypothetical protein RRG08_062078 [Elysia crispata]
MHGWCLGLGYQSYQSYGLTLGKYVPGQRPDCVTQTVRNSPVPQASSQAALSARYLPSLLQVWLQKMD